MFLAVILAGLMFGRLFRGCLKIVWIFYEWFVIAGLFIWISKSDPVLAHKLCDLARDCMEKLREFVMEL